MNWLRIVWLSVWVLLAACGGSGSSSSGGGGSTPPPGPGVPEPESPEVSCVAEETGAALLACFQGIYPPEHVYLGAVTWTQLVVGSDGSVTFDGEEALSFPATEIVEVHELPLAAGLRLEVDVESGGVSRTLGFFARGDVLWDIEYEQAGARRGVTVAALLPTRQRHPLGQLSNGVSGSLDGELFPLNVSAGEPSWADADGLYIAALRDEGTPDEVAWRLKIDAPLPGQADAGTLPWDYHCLPGSDAISVSFVSPETGTLTAGGVDNPGRCVITLDYVEHLSPEHIDWIDGYFVAELQSDTADTPVRILDGFFRIDPPH